MDELLKRFPKVLIITKSQINDIDSAGASIRNWFTEWPSDHLAQIFSGVASGNGGICDYNYQIGSDDRRLGSTFFKLKGSSLGDAAQPYTNQSNKQSGNIAYKYFKKLLRFVGKILIDSGTWELIFTPCLSPRLKSWIEEYKPDVMFVQGCDISFMRLPLMIHKAYSIPICFNIVDDWVEHLYTKSLFAPLMQYIVQRTFLNLLHTSTCRFTIGTLMAEEYQKRYGVSFKPLMQCDDIERFCDVKLNDNRDANSIEIVYSGSLALGRWKSFVDLAAATAQFRSKGININITAFAPFIPEEANEQLMQTAGLFIKNAVSNNKLPYILAKADILFLPESFAEPTRTYIKFSVSTKAHLYMMSCRPSLVYGPPEIGTVDYARREGWGYVVDNEGSSFLFSALEILINDKELRSNLVNRGRCVSKNNHDGITVREKLRNALLKIDAY